MIPRISAMLVRRRSEENEERLSAISMSPQFWETGGEETLAGSVSMSMILDTSGSEDIKDSPTGEAVQGISRPRQLFPVAAEGPTPMVLSYTEL